MGTMMDALKQFEATEANLLKLQNLWSELESLFSSTAALGHNPEYDDRCLSFNSILAALPLIDGWKPELSPPDPEGVNATRFDLMELGEPWETARFEAGLWSDSRQLGEFRFRLDQKRRALIREALLSLMDEFDTCLRDVEPIDSKLPTNTELSDSSDWRRLREITGEIEVLLGSSVQRPPAWPNLRRHMHFGMLGDLNDIRKADWPAVKASLHKGLYGANEPVPVASADLGQLVAARPRGQISTKLDWAKLDAEGFERLVFALISGEHCYENPEWLMRTNAPDRGRDLSVTRIIADPLSDTRRERIVFQCKHWLSKSVSATDAGAVKDQMAHWSDPRVDVLIIATSGRFSADAVHWVERHNATVALPRIEMWPDSRLERLIAARPALIAEFGLR